MSAATPHPSIAAARALEQQGQPDEAVGVLRQLWWSTEGEARTELMLDSVRCLLAAGRVEDVWYPLAEAAKDTLSPKALRQADRFLRQACKTAELPAKRRCKLAIAANTTLDTLTPLLRAQAFAAGLDLDIYLAPFDQVVQEIQQAGSGMDRFAPDAVLLAMNSRWLGLAEEESDPAAAADRCLQQLRHLWKLCQSRWGAQALQCNFEVPAFPAQGRLSASRAQGLGRLLRRLNLDLWEAAETSPGVAIVDLESASARFGRDRWSDPVLWHVAKQYPSAAALPAFGDEIVATLRAVFGLSMKCAVLDLDNTLWGGVIGEDGLHGIRLGGTAAGEAFVAFQRYLHALSQSGVLLAVCSKNNDADARQPFQQHPEMVLRESDIAVFCSNWEPKDQNLRSIARTLNIGTDALVFIDDNPAERARVRQNLPEVEVIALPTEPALYAEAVARRRLFDKLTLTEEDRARTQSIQQNIVRQELTASAGSVDEYLLGLNLVVDLFPFDEPNLARIGQLINKTNQFNVTTRRRTEAELRGLMAAGWYTQAMRVSDRLGDSGLTGVMMAVPEGETLRLDTWLMSCRVLGRRLEEAMFAALVAYARQQGFRRIRCEFIPTAKNAVSQDLFATLGCTPDGEEGLSRFFVWETERPMEMPAVLHCTDRTHSAAPVSS